jgi:hypothetical protein
MTDGRILTGTHILITITERFNVSLDRSETFWSGFSWVFAFLERYDPGNAIQVDPRPVAECRNAGTDTPVEENQYTFFCFHFHPASYKRIQKMFLKHGTTVASTQ